VARFGDSWPPLLPHSHHLASAAYVFPTDGQGRCLINTTKTTKPAGYPPVLADHLFIDSI